jgi:nucleoid-associated protein YgaU
MEAAWQGSETSFTSIFEAVALGALGYLVFLPVLVALRRIRVRVRPPGMRSAALAVVGLSLAVAPGGASAQLRTRSHRPSGSLFTPPWSDTGGFPPPRPPVQTTTGPSTDTSFRVHPAIHRRRSARSVALFSRARSPRSATEDGPPAAARAARRAAMARHPAGKGRAHQTAAPRHRVRAGDSLWSIAAGALDTDDPTRIALYWPLIHRANRSVVGPDANLIYPGQILELPPEPR